MIRHLDGGKYSCSVNSWDHTLCTYFLFLLFLKNSFAALSTHLRKREVIDCTRRCLQRIHMTCHLLYPNCVPRESLPPSVNVRVFLAAYMVAFRPDSVFENQNGTLEKNLFQSAVPVLECFQTLCEQFDQSSEGLRSLNQELVSSFVPKLCTYFENFKAWKVPDEEKLCKRIFNALIALYGAYRHLPDQAEEPNSRLAEDFRKQIQRLRDKLVQIKGLEALNEFDRKLEQEGLEGISAAYASDNAVVPAGDIVAQNIRLSNEQLAHELMYDSSFQLDENGGCGEDGVLCRIKETFHSAFWNSLVDDMKCSKPCYVRVLRVFAEIRDGLLDLAGSPLDENVKVVLDIDRIRVKLESGEFSFGDWKELGDSVFALIARIQAVKRDEENKEKYGVMKAVMDSCTPEDIPRVLTDMLKMFLDFVNMMRIDAANARLRLIAPVVRDHGVEFERGKFKDKLRDGILTLERTKVCVILVCFVCAMNNPGFFLNCRVGGRMVSFRPDRV